MDKQQLIDALLAVRGQEILMDTALAPFGITPKEARRTGTGPSWVEYLFDTPKGSLTLSVVADGWNYDTLVLDRPPWLNKTGTWCGEDFDWIVEAIVEAFN